MACYDGRNMYDRYKCWLLTLTEFLNKMKRCYVIIV